MDINEEEAEVKIKKKKRRYRQGKQSLGARSVSKNYRGTQSEVTNIFSQDKYIQPIQN